MTGISIACAFVVVAALTFAAGGGEQVGQLISAFAVATWVAMVVAGVLLGWWIGKRINKVFDRDDRFWGGW